MHKPATKSRTNRTVAVLIGVVVCNAARRYMDAVYSPEIEAIINEEVVPALVASLGGLAMWFRQLANKAS